MLETLVYLVLGGAYVLESREEAKEEQIRALKMKVFRYAILNGVTYNSVVKDLQDGRLTVSQIDKYLERI